MELPTTALWQVLVLGLAGAIAYILNSINHSIQDLRADLRATTNQLGKLDTRLSVLENKLIRRTEFHDGGGE